MMRDPIAQARALGKDAGLAAASWVFDGNTTDETYRAFLAGVDEGDPAIYSALAPPAWLSGEWADSMTPAELGCALGILCPGDDDWTEDGAGYVFDMACSEYEQAADDAYWAELERVAVQQTT